MAEAAGIFVSHAHEDNAWCRTFVAALRHAGAAVWYDEHDLGYGALSDEIERELRARPIFLVILSPASVGKPWVRREMNAAMRLIDQNPQRIILPVVAQKTEIPLFWDEYKRVSGPGDSGVGAKEAAGRVIHAVGIMPAEAPSAVPPPVARETADEANDRGNGLYAQKRYEEALSAYERATTLEPENTRYWTNKGAALGSLEWPEEALSAYEHALTLNPLDVVAWNGKCRVLYDLKQYQEALFANDQALTLDPLDAYAWNSKGSTLAHLLRPEEALSAYEHALTLDPRYVDAWNGKGGALFGLEQPEEALSAFDQALTLDPRYVAAWDNKIALLKELERPAQAQETERQRDEALRSQ